MKKLIAIITFMLIGLFTKAQPYNISSNQYSIQGDAPDAAGKGSLIWLYQTDDIDNTVYQNYIIQFIDSTGIKFKQFRTSVSSNNSNSRLIGTDANGNVRPYDVSALPKQSLSISSNSVSISGGNTIVLPALAVAPHSATRTVNSATFSIGAASFVNYSIRIQCNTTVLLTAAAGTVALQYSTNGGSTWIDVAQVENSLSGLIGENKQTSVLSGFIPASAITRLVPTIQTGAGIGSTTITYVRGQENY